MKTIYASSKTLVAPTVSTVGGGNLAAGTYYLWLVRRNRAGYSEPSPSASITVSASGSIVTSTNILK